jgi:hypothetical protein
MDFNYEATLWYALLLDCILVCLLSFFYLDWYKEKWPAIQKIFPLTKGWCITYFLLVIWLGCLLYRLKVLPW